MAAKPPGVVMGLCGFPEQLSGAEKGWHCFFAKWHRLSGQLVVFPRRVTPFS